MESIKLIGQRIREMREILDISIEEMSRLTEMTPQDYLDHEAGNRDFSFTFLNKCSTRFNLDLAELLTGENAYLKAYSIVRSGKGLAIERRKGFDYRHLASRFNNRTIEPYLVTVPYQQEAQDKPIKVSTHSGQEMDFVLEGTLKIYIDGKTEILNEGDCVYYDSSLPHGMIAINNKACKFLALLAKE